MARPPRSSRQQLGWPLAAEIAYRVEARRLLRAARALLADEIATNGKAWNLSAEMFRPDAARADAPDDGGFGDWGGALARAFERIAQRMLDFFITTPAALQRVSGAVDARQKAEWRRNVRAHYGVDIERSEPWLTGELRAWEIENTDLIKSIPQQALAQTRGLFADALRRGTTQRELQGIVAERFAVADSRAALIARDQIGKLDGQITEQRQRALGVREFVWRTSGDERVRDAHRALNGKKFAWNKPPSEGRPGQPVRCRCRAEAVFPEIDDLLAR